MCDGHLSFREQIDTGFYLRNHSTRRVLAQVNLPISANSNT